jgi:hypothetical protein
MADAREAMWHPIHSAPSRTCTFCEGPIPEDERAIEALTKNGWAHFECWYDGTPFPRDPQTGRQERHAPTVE